MVGKEPGDYWDVVAAAPDREPVARVAAADAIAAARMPTWRGLLREWPNATLRASEDAVGLPPGQMGNSEVGHLTIGSGRILFQDLMRVNKAIEDGSFFENPALLAAFEHFHGDGEWERVLLFAIAVGALDHAGVEVAVFLKLTAGNGVDNLRTRAAMVGVEVGTALGDHLGLVLHVLAAAGDERDR